MSSLDLIEADMTNIENFQVGDTIETNDDAREIQRLAACMGEPLLAGQSEYLAPGEHGKVLAVDYRGGFVYVKFDDGTEDNMPNWALDVTYHPTNDPTKYERTLLDLLP